MFLENALTFFIILVGQWKSSGFFKYACKQTLEAYKEISTRILKMSFMMSYLLLLCQLIILVLETATDLLLT